MPNDTIVMVCKLCRNCSCSILVATTTHKHTPTTKPTVEPTDTPSLATITAEPSSKPISPSKKTESTNTSTNTSVPLRSIPTETKPPTPTQTRIPLATNTPPPTATQPPTFTSVPSPTNRATNTPIPLPTSPPTHTAVPTRVAQPTHTLAPVVVAASCAVPAVFKSVWTQVESKLGCVVNSVVNNSATYQSFRNGYMVWVKQTDTIYVLPIGGNWSQHANSWRDGDSDFSCFEAQAQNRPLKGFGRVWCNISGLKGVLGEATSDEITNSFSQQQSFTNGYMIELFGSQIVTLFDDGSWREN